jgi:hypothetical protein
MVLVRLWRLGLAGSALLATPQPGAARGAAGTRASCIDASRGISRGGEIVAAGAHLRVALGAVVFVVLVEPAAYTGGRYPSSFPWLTASSRGAARG